MEILDNVKRFSTFPNSLKNGIILLYAAWIWYFMVLYLFFFGGAIPTRQLISGFIACTCIFTLKKWARALCVLVNVFVIIQILPASLSLLGMENKFQSGLYLLVAVVLFAGSSYFFLIKQTSDYLKSENETDADNPSSKIEQK